MVKEKKKPFSTKLLHMIMYSLFWNSKFYYDFIFRRKYR